MLCDSVNDAVIRVSALVTAGQTSHTRILSQTKGQTVLLTKLLQLRNHAIRDAGVALGQQANHHRLEDIKLVLDREVDKVRIDQHLIRRANILVRCEEQRRRDFLNFSHRRLALVFGLLSLGLLGDILLPKLQWLGKKRRSYNLESFGLNNFFTLANFRVAFERPIVTTGQVSVSKQTIERGQEWFYFKRSDG